uniref:Uncharacterized protein n=1 Tax=Panagrolaimus davidi TaxID=227884 RepID=A0A914Q355_9BILA
MKGDMIIKKITVSDNDGSSADFDKKGFRSSSISCNSTFYIAATLKIKDVEEMKEMCVVPYQIQISSVRLQYLKLDHYFKDELVLPGYDGLKFTYYAKKIKISTGNDIEVHVTNPYDVEIQGIPAPKKYSNSLKNPKERIVLRGINFKTSKSALHNLVRLKNSWGYLQHVRFEGCIFDKLSLEQMEHVIAEKLTFKKCYLKCSFKAFIDAIQPIKKLVLDGMNYPPRIDMMIFKKSSKFSFKNLKIKDVKRKLNVKGFCDLYHSNHYKIIVGCSKDLTPLQQNKMKNSIFEQADNNHGVVWVRIRAQQP